MGVSIPFVNASSECFGESANIYFKHSRLAGAINAEISCLYGTNEPAHDFGIQGNLQDNLQSDSGRRYLSHL